MFLYLASGHTLSFFLSDYWCYSEYLSCPLCKLLSRLLNDAKECHISFSSSASSFSVYLWIINRRERGFGKEGYEKSKKRQCWLSSFFYSFACQDHQVRLLLLIRKCLWYYRSTTTVTNTIHLLLSYCCCFCSFLCRILFSPREFARLEH